VGIAGAQRANDEVVELVGILNDLKMANGESSDP
jgi:hypothetical protein